MNRWSVLAVLLIAAAALALRVPQLGHRPLHNDEAVNAFKVTELWQEGRYVYDPDEYHGPTLHYATVPFLWLSGAGHPNELPDATLRLAPVAFGVGLILLSLLFVDGLGRTAVIWAALFTAVSPAMVFYSRYFIHEMLLVFFTALTLGAAWRYLQTRAARWAVLAGVGLGLMSATKETFVLALAAMVLAWIITAWWTGRKGDTPVAQDRDEVTRMSPFQILDCLRTHWNWRHFALAAGAAAAIWLVLFTSFFTNWSGPLDSVLTYLPWLKRAGGESPHIHPWYFYLHRLAWFQPARSPIWSEGLILLLALVAIAVALFGKRPPLHRFLALYAIILTAIYSVISYKTPWCLLGFHHGLILLAGIGAATLLEFCRARMLKVALLVVLGALTLQLTWQSARANYTLEPDPANRKSWRANFHLAADPRNPYVYAQTSPNLLELMTRVDGIARVAPTGYETVVKVMAPGGDYWPVPWYLRRFQNVGWYEELPADPYAAIMLVSPEFKARYDDESDRRWIMAGIHALRPGKFFELYVELELWKEYVATLPRPVD
jgi:uncharacterized protein (TIGR03663 family)